jgi:hypothetical protein
MTAHYQPTALLEALPFQITAGVLLYPDCEYRLET